MTPKQHHVSYYDRNMNKRTFEVKRKEPVKPQESIERFDIVYVCLLVLFFCFGVFTGYSVKPEATCTTTITDMQGVEHTLRGKAD
jgi:hypothetical protein